VVSPLWRFGYNYSQTVLDSALQNVLDAAFLGRKYRFKFLVDRRDGSPLRLFAEVRFQDRNGTN
jgi:hypothetical protein